MSGLARILNAWGYAVSGSDARRSPLLDQLRAEGIPVTIGHRAATAGARPTWLSRPRPCGQTIPRSLPLSPRESARQAGEAARDAGRRAAGSRRRRQPRQVDDLRHARDGPPRARRRPHLRHRRGPRRERVPTPRPALARRWWSKPTSSTGPSSGFTRTSRSSLTSSTTTLIFSPTPESYDAAFAAFLAGCARKAHWSSPPTIPAALVLWPGTTGRHRERRHLWRDADADWRLERTEEGGRSLSRRHRHSLDTGGAGGHNAINATAALAALVSLSYDATAAAAALVSFTGVGRRFDTKGGARGILVVDEMTSSERYRVTPRAARAITRSSTFGGFSAPHFFRSSLLADFAAPPMLTT